MNIPYAFKKCRTCGEWKVANNINFCKSKTGKWNLNSKCKKCTKEYQKEYREKNKDKISEYQKEYREKNKDKISEYYEKNKDKRIEYQKEYVEKNKDKIKEYYEKNKDKIKEYVEKNKDKIKEYQKEYYEKNKGEIKEYQKEWNKNNSEKKFNSHNKRRSKLENQGRGITNEQYIECNNWFNWKCAYSGEKMKNDKSTHGRTIDHIVALDNGGLNEPWNIVPMRKGYNSSKNATENSLDWYKEQKYFNEERLNKIVEWQIYAYEKWGGKEFGELILITDLI